MSSPRRTPEQAVPLPPPPTRAGIGDALRQVFQAETLPIEIARLLARLR